LFIDPSTRRTTLGLGLLAAVMSLFPNSRLAAQLSPAYALNRRFLRWSRTATGFADISPSTAQACLELVLRSGVTPEDLSGLEPEAYRATAMEKRLLEAWYIGVFKTDASSRMRSYETTLMWPAAGLDPPPGTCSSGPERWVSAPRFRE
jgi:hypothetical protein